MAIKIKALKFPEPSWAIKREIHRAYLHTSLFSNFEGDHPSKLIKETPLLRWYKCQDCGEEWRERKYENS